MKRTLTMVFVLVVGLNIASLAFANPAKSTVKKKTADLDSAVSFLKKHNKPEVVGKVITALKKEGYRVTEMFYCSTESLDGFSVSLKGSHDVEIRCEVVGFLNAKREKQLGISSMEAEDDFTWEGGKFHPYPGGSTTHWQKVLQKILGNFTVTSVSVYLPSDFLWKRKAVWEYGNNIIQKLQPKLGKPAKKEFIWEEGPESREWYVEWGKPAKYVFNCFPEISELRAIVEEMKVF